MVITTPLTVQVISPTDDDEEISTSVSQSMHTAANQSYKREGSASGTDSRETTPPDDLLEEQEIPEQIEAELMTADVSIIHQIFIAPSFGEVSVSLHVQVLRV